MLYKDIMCCVLLYCYCRKYDNKSLKVHILDAIFDTKTKKDKWSLIYDRTDLDVIPSTVPEFFLYWATACSIGGVLLVVGSS